VRIFVFEVLVDHGRVVDHDFLVDQHRDLAERVHPEKFRPLLFSSAKIDVHQLVGEILFR
jgi:hypothetical protein